MRSLIATIFLALPVSAQELSVDADVVEDCFAVTPIGQLSPLCLGAASNQCQSQSPQGRTTTGITSCITSETDVWDAILNSEYKQARDHMTGLRPDLADRLLAAQRAWIAFRDAECALAYERWTDGTLRGIVFANCRMVKTAARAVELRDMRAEGT